MGSVGFTRPARLPYHRRVISVLYVPVSTATTLVHRLMSALLADLSLVIPFYRSEKNIILEASMLDASTNTSLLFSTAVLVSGNDTYL